MAAGVAGVCLLWAAAAQATTVPDVLYKPPLLQFTDRYAHATGEDLTVTRQGPNYVFENPGGIARNIDSDPGCPKSYATVFPCPIAGVELLLLDLKQADDRALVDLGRRARFVKQVVRGGPGADRLRGKAGRQRLVGGPDDDVLRGGRGRDVLIGGDGVDACFGGPGRDVLRGCE